MLTITVDSDKFFPSNLRRAFERLLRELLQAFEYFSSSLKGFLKTFEDLGNSCARRHHIEEIVSEPTVNTLLMLCCYFESKSLRILQN